MRVLTCVISFNPDPTRKVLISTLRNAVLPLEKLRASVQSHPSISFHFPPTLVTVKPSGGVDAPPEGLGAARFSPICWEPETGFFAHPSNKLVSATSCLPEFHILRPFLNQRLHLPGSLSNHWAIRLVLTNGVGACLLSENSETPGEGQIHKMSKTRIPESPRGGELPINQKHSCGARDTFILC